MKQTMILIALVLASVMFLACSKEDPANTAVDKRSATNVPPPSPLPSATIDELASGKKVYDTNCATCHKENGTGGPVEIEGKKLNPDNLTSDKMKGFTDEKIIGYIMKGVEDEGMPSFKDKLSEGEMRDVVKYIRQALQKNAKS